MTVRILHEDELSYCRERIVAWCSKPFPEMTLGQVQSLAMLLAMERQKAAVAADPSPRRARRICSPEGLPITLPAGEPDFEDEVTTPKGKKP